MRYPEGGEFDWNHRGCAGYQEFVRELSPKCTLVFNCLGFLLTGFTAAPAPRGISNCPQFLVVIPDKSPIILQKGLRSIRFLIEWNCFP